MQRRTERERLLSAFRVLMLLAGIGGAFHIACPHEVAWLERDRSIGWLVCVGSIVGSELPYSGINARTDQIRPDQITFIYLLSPNRGDEALTTFTVLLLYYYQLLFTNQYLLPTISL